MKTSLMLAVSIALTAVLGCSPRGGGIGGDESFRIVTPVLGATVKQGETKEATVTVSRGDYFKQDVKLEIKASEGISVEPTSYTVKANEKGDVHLRITASKKAALGDYKIYVKGTPDKGEPTSIDFKVKVAAP